MKVVVRRTNGAKPWYYRVVAKNGTVILVSETYATKANAKRAAERFASELRDEIEVVVEERFSINRFKK